jgi:hypothetical protein
MSLIAELKRRNVFRVGVSCPSLDSKQNLKNHAGPISGGQVSTKIKIPHLGWRLTLESRPRSQVMLVIASGPASRAL